MLAWALGGCGLLPSTTTEPDADTHVTHDDTADSGGQDSRDDTGETDAEADDAHVRALTDLPEGEAPCAAPVLVRIDYTVDGDTFYGSTDAGGEDVKVRMIGMDTPEVAHDDPAECFGNEAWTYTAAQLEGRLAWLTFDAECTDVYDRTLAYVIRDTADPDGFFNRNLLRHGYATTLTIRPNDTFERVFADDEDGARDADLGGWGGCF